IGEATIFLYNYARFDAQEMMSVMDAEGVTSVCAPPTVWRMLIQADLTKMVTPPRKVLAAGEPLNPVVIEAVNTAWNADIRDGFGQTESTLQIANTPGQNVKQAPWGEYFPAITSYLLIPRQTKLSRVQAKA